MLTLDKCFALRNVSELLVIAWFHDLEMTHLKGIRFRRQKLRRILNLSGGGEEEGFLLVFNIYCRPISHRFMTTLSRHRHDDRTMKIPPFSLAQRRKQMWTIVINYQ